MTHKTSGHTVFLNQLRFSGTSGSGLLNDSEVKGEGNNINSRKLYLNEEPVLSSVSGTLGSNKRRREDGCETRRDTDIGQKHLPLY